MRSVLLGLAVAAATVLLLATSALAGLRSPEATAGLAASLADEDAVRDAVTEALVDALLTEAADRSDVPGGLLAFIRPLLEQAAAAAIDSPAGRAALTSALSDALRQLTFSGPIVIDLRAAVLVAAESAPPPLDTLARVAVEQGSVGVVVIGEGSDEPSSVPPAPPTDDDLRRVAGLPANVTMILAGLLLSVLIVVLIGRDPTARPRRLILAGAPLVLVGAGAAAIIRMAPMLVLDRFAAVPVEDAGPIIDLVPLLTDGLVGLLASTSLLAMVLAVVGVGLSAAGTRALFARTAPSAVRSSPETLTAPS